MQLTGQARGRHGLTHSGTGSHRELLRQGGLHASLCQEQFEGGLVQWRCPDGDVLVDGTVRERVAQSA